MDSTTRSRDLEALKSAHFSDEDVRLASLSQIVVELFDWIGGPIEVDFLVRMVGYLLKRKRRSDRVIDRAGAARWDAHLSVILDTISSAAAMAPMVNAGSQRRNFIGTLKRIGFSGLIARR